MKNVEKLVADCEEILRAGQGQLVAQNLKDLNLARIPRAFRLSLANICRRAGLFSAGLRILTALVRNGDATAEEKAEYAVLLERCGAVDEALLVLREVNAAEVSVVHLYRAFCHFKSWDYAAAIPELRAYSGTTLTPYGALIARVNLAAALVVTRDYEAALTLLEENIRAARADGFSRLNANCLELSAQVHFHRRDFAAARASLEEASKILGGETSSDQLFVLKWQRILDAFASGNPASLRQLRREAVDRGDGESAREADLFQLMIRNDRNLLEHLYLGTPFEAYRERVRALLNCDEVREDLIVGSPHGAIFDVRTGTLSGASAEVNPGKKIHQLLAVLLRDLYRPARIGGLFSALYPREHFDIFTSPARVHQILFRTREWLADNRLPVDIQASGQAYSLNVRDDFGFRIPGATYEVGGHAAQFNRLETLSSEFSSREARALLGVSPASCKRILKWAVDNGKLNRRGLMYSRVG